VENVGLWCQGYSIYFRLMSICFVRFVFLFLLGWFCCFCGVYFIISDLVYFIDWNIITLNGRSIIMTFLFDWMSLLFIGFVFIISSLVILYSDDYIFGDLNIIRFILLVLWHTTTTFDLTDWEKAWEMSFRTVGLQTRHVPGNSPNMKYKYYHFTTFGCST